MKFTFSMDAIIEPRLRKWEAYIQQQQQIKAKVVKKKKRKRG